MYNKPKHDNTKIFKNHSHTTACAGYQLCENCFLNVSQYLQWPQCKLVILLSQQIV